MTAAAPLVSVVIPTFNRSALLIQAVESVLLQTYKNLEVVVVDDGSTDGTETILETTFRDPRVKYAYQDNRGLAASRNRGIELASGEVVAFLDSDDLWLPNKLAKQVAVLQASPSTGVVYCDFSLINESGRGLPKKWRPSRRGDLRVDLLFANVIAGSGSAVMVRSSCFRDVGGFDERLVACEDHDMWRRLSMRYEFAKVAEPFVKIRVHGASMQANPQRMQQGMMLHLEKILSETPEALAHHLPAVTRQFHRVVFATWVRGGQLGAGVRFLVAAIQRFPALAAPAPVWMAWGALYRLVAKLAQKHVASLL